LFAAAGRCVGFESLWLGIGAELSLMNESIHEQSRIKRSKIERFGGRRFDAFDVYEFVIVKTFQCDLEGYDAQAMYG